MIFFFFCGSKLSKTFYTTEKDLNNRVPKQIELVRSSENNIKNKNTMA